jgi:hypothetical protein
VKPRRRGKGREERAKLTRNLIFCRSIKQIAALGVFSETGGTLSLKGEGQSVGMRKANTGNILSFFVIIMGDDQ